MKLTRYDLVDYAALALIYIATALIAIAIVGGIYIYVMC